MIFHIFSFMTSDIHLQQEGLYESTLRIYPGCYVPQHYFDCSGTVHAKGVI